MKNLYIKAICLATVMSLFSSCENDLNVDPRDAQTENDFLNNPDNAIQLVNGVYSKMLDFNMNSFSWIGITSITSDDADKGSTPGDTGTDKDKLDKLDFNSSLLSFNETWEGRYEGIYRANNALFYLEKLTVDPALKNRLIGEVKFLKALFYFDLVRCFGGVPLIKEKIQNINDYELVNNIVFTRKSKTETYAYIESELLDAIDRLPVSYGADNTGRATSGAAQALLAKVYLYEEKWQQAFDKAGEVMGSGQYALLPNYEDVWREVGENKKESIFEVQAKDNNGISSYSYVQMPRGVPDLGWGFNTPSLTLVNSYQAGDLRKNATILFVPSTLWDGTQASLTWNNPRYNYKAYQSPTAEPFTNRESNGKNLRILKYSDVLLIRAEAAYHLGDIAEATAQIKTIRNRAGLPDPSGLTLQDIYNERHWEMAMEHERWFDLVRTGQALNAMAADGKTFIVGKHELFPIPEEQIVQSGNKLTQNPGYN